MKGFRFRKSKKIAPGIRMNIGKSGRPSVSVGNRLFGATVGRRGPAGRLSAPGTGASYRRGCMGCFTIPLAAIMLALLLVAAVIVL